jgi:ankyrin repeat protein
MHPLHLAVERMDIAAARQLLVNGADPNAEEPTLGGARPLHLAIDIECEDACRRYDAGELESTPRSSISALLVEFGADPNLPDYSGQSALDWATERNHQQAVYLFTGKAT